MLGSGKKKLFNLKMKGWNKKIDLFAPFFHAHKPNSTH